MQTGSFILYLRDAGSWRGPGPTKMVAVLVDRGELAMITSSSHGRLAFELAPPFPAFVQFPDVDRAVLSVEYDCAPEAATSGARLDAAWPDFPKQVLAPSSLR